MLEEKLLSELKPDLLITQELGDVCAVSFSEVKQLAARLPGTPAVLSLTPPNLNGIFEDVQTVAAARGMPERGQKVIAHLHARLEQVRQSVADKARLRVVALEWLDPPYAAGHWVPEMIAWAGGEEVPGRAGEKSFRVMWEQVMAAHPDVILLIPCGYSAESAQREWEALPKPGGWETIPAARSGRV